MPTPLRHSGASPFAANGKFGLRTRTRVVLPARYDAVWPLGTQFYGFRAGDLFGIASAQTGAVLVPCGLPAHVDGFRPLPLATLLAFQRPDGTFAPNLHRAHPLVVQQASQPGAYYEPASLPAERWTPALWLGPLWVLVLPERQQQLWLSDTLGTAEWKPCADAPDIVDFLRTGVAVELPSGVDFLWHRELLEMEFLSEVELDPANPAAMAVPHPTDSPAGQALDEATRQWLRGHIEELRGGKPPLNLDQWLDETVKDVLDELDDDEADDDDDDYSLADYLTEGDAETDEFFGGAGDTLPGRSFADRLAAAARQPALPPELAVMLRAAGIAPAAPRPCFADLPDRAWRLCEVHLAAHGLTRDGEEVDFEAWCEAYPDVESVPPSLVDQLVELAWLHANRLLDTSDPEAWYARPGYELPGPDLTPTTAPAYFEEYELHRLSTGLRQ